MARDVMTDKMAEMLLRLADSNLPHRLYGGDMKTARSLCVRGLVEVASELNHCYRATTKGRQLAREILAKREGTS